MLLGAGLLVLIALALLVLFQMGNALGAWRGVALGSVMVLLVGSVWGALDWRRRHEPPLPEDMTAAQPIPSQACFKCHEAHYKSWQHTFHRTMTREATPEYVKANFDNATFRYAGVTSHMSRKDDHFFIETVDPQWAGKKFSQGMPVDTAGPQPRHVFSVDRIVGSHWFQQMLHRDEQGRYLRLPLVYHLVEDRWIHINGAFLSPESGYFYNKVARLERDLRLLPQHAGEQEPRAGIRPANARL